jgi:hypothetical protein
VRRLTASLLLLVGTSAAAHVVGFTFFTPAGLDGRTDGGTFTLSWADGPDSKGTAAFTLHAARDGAPPFRLPTADVDLETTPRPVPDLADTFRWDTRGVAPGCYQPFARMTDPEEGVTLRPADGLVTVSPDDGGNRWPVAWVTTPSGSTPNDAGALDLRVGYDDPDDVLELTVRWASPDAGGTLASGLPLTPGRGETAYAVNPAFIAAAGPLYLQIEVRSADGHSCSAWWQGALLTASVDGGSDAGTSGTGGGGGAGGSGGGNSNPPGCGCNTTPLFGGALLLLLIHRRRPGPRVRRVGN